MDSQLTKTLRIIGTVAVAGTILTVGPVASAMAAGTGDTTATFTLAGGSLDVTPCGRVGLHGRLIQLG